MKLKILGLTMHILYGGFRFENEHFSSKYKSVWPDKFVFGNPPQSICFPLATSCSARRENIVQIVQ